MAKASTVHCTASIAQLVGRRAPISDGPSSRRVLLSLHDPPGAVGGSDRGQLKSVSGADRVRICAHVKISILNSAIILELMTGGWESGSALQAMLPAGPDFSDPSIQNIRTKIIRNYFP